MKSILLFFLTCCPIFLLAQDPPSTIVIKPNANNEVRIDFEGGGNSGPNKQNLYIGEDAGLNNTGYGNVFLGRRTGRANTTGFLNTYVGKSAGEFAIGSNNTLLGNQTGEKLNGNKNVLLGNIAGLNLNGNNNVMIGNNAGTDVSGTSNFNVFIGNNAGRDQYGSNQLVIENSSADSTEMLIYGQFDNDILRFNAHTDIYSNSAVDDGLYVKKTHTGNSDIPAVKGENTATDFWGIGVQGWGGYIGVQGNSQGTGNGSYFGTSGISNGNNTGSNYGMYGYATGAGMNYSIFGTSNGGANSYAGYFQGQVLIKQQTIDDVYFNIQNANGSSVLTIANDDVVEVNSLKVNWSVEMDSLTTNLYTELTNVTTNGTTDIEIENGKRINKATSMKYYIAINGTFPPNGGSIPINDIMIGEIKLFPYGFNPSGWLPCEGQLLNIVDYTPLFALIGTIYGGDGTTTFALPDMRSAVPHHN